MGQERATYAFYENRFDVPSGQGKNKYMGSQRVENLREVWKMYAPAARHRTYKQRENLLCYYSSQGMSLVERGVNYELRR
jgi:hypothetical protein